MAEIKNDNRAKQDHPGFYCEVLELALSVTKKLYKRGDPARRAAAEELANYAKSKNVVSAWIDAEWQFLQECLFAAGSQEFGNVELPIDQAELALSQVGLDIDDTIKLQIVLASAYALRARNHLSMDDLQSAALIFTDISPSAPPVDVRVLGANILMTWIQLALHDYETGIEATSVQDVIEYLSTTDSASNSELVPSSQPLDEDPEPDIRVICEAARLILLSLGSGEGEQSSLMLARRVHAFREELSVDSTSRNGVWLSPIMAPVESRLFARAGLHELAIGTLRTALGQVEGGVFRQQILENLYLTLSEVDLPRTIIEIIIQGSRAAAWTYNEEVKEGFDPSRLKEHVRAALAVFARSKLETAQSAGVLHTARAEPESNTFEGQTLGSAIVNSGFPEIDNVEFPVNQGDVISDTGIIVILLPGHSAGTAIVIPRGGRIRDAIPVVLPRFSRRFVESIYFSGEAGWMRALLRWRNKMEIKPFDAAIRSVAVQLWDTAIGPVVETLQRMEADAGVELIVDARHRLLPWSCASPSLEMGEVAGDLLKMSNGVDLGTLILGQARQRAGISRPSRPSVMTHAALLVTAPFLADRSEQARIFNDFSGADFEMISIVDGINDLPMSRVEGDCLRSAFAEKTISFEGGLPRLLAPQVMPLLERARILHLASHGFWSPTHPWASAIMLGPEFPLFAANIRSDLRLQGATVLLSACESGMGGTGIPDRDGIVDEGGLVHAFLLSGAQSVLASSWIVHDLSSVVFMEMVFTELASGADIFTAATKARQFVRSMSSSDLASLINRAARVRPDLSEALHRSADELLIGDAHPFSSPVYWGAQFVASVGGRKALQT